MRRDESSELPAELVFPAGVLKMKVMFLLLELILLLMLQARAKIPLKEYFDGEKVMPLEGVFPWWRTGKVPCLDTVSPREQRSDKTHLPVFAGTPVPAGSHSPSGFLALNSTTFGCLNALVGQSAG